MKSLYKRIIVIICCLFMLSGCGLSEFLDKLSGSISSSQGIGGSGEGCKIYSNLDVLVENENVSILSNSSEIHSIIENVNKSTFMANACYIVNGTRYERISSGFIVKKEQLENVYKYYLVSNASKLFYRQINKETGETIVNRNPKYVEVVFGDYKRYYAKIESYFERLDIVILTIETKDELNVLPLGDSDGLYISDVIYSMGTPELGVSLLNTVIKGNISGLNKDSTLYYNNEQIASYSTHQFDAPTNLGMEGGPVFNSNGEIIGILTYKYGAGDDYESLSRFIPINNVKSCFECLLNDEEYQIPTLGLQVMDLYNAIINDYVTWSDDVGVYEGCYIDEVVRDSLSYYAGIIQNGIIVGAYLNDKYYPIKGNSSLSTLLVLYKKGDTLKLEIQYVSNKKVYNVIND